MKESAQYSPLQPAMYLQECFHSTELYSTADICTICSLLRIKLHISVFNYL